MELVDWWKAVVLRRYAKFDGRARPREYWMFALAGVLISIVGSILSVALGDAGNAVDVLMVVYSLAVIVPSIAVGVRRLHDIDRSGWWLLIGLIPLVGAIVLLVFAVQGGTPGHNRFGPNPAEMPGGGLTDETSSGGRASRHRPERSARPLQCDITTVLVRSWAGRPGLRAHTEPDPVIPGRLLPADA